MSDCGPSAPARCGSYADRCTIRCHSLDLHLPGTAEQIKVVDEVAAERSLQRLEDVAQPHAKDLRLVAVDIEINRRVGRGEGTEDTPQPWIFVRRDHEPTLDLCKLLRISATQILQHVGETASSAETDNRRRRQWNHGTPADLAEFRPQPRDHIPRAKS